MTLLVALAAYLVVQLAIGAWVAPRIRTEDDYLVAGRRLGYPLATFSLFATWFGAETVLAGAGRAYRDGLTLTTAEPFGYGLCLILLGVVFAVPLWRRKLTTLADLFRERYSVGVERVAALILVPSSILWAAAQMRGFGYVLTTAVPISIPAAVGAAAAICILYTAMGGLLADAITDLVQGIVVIVGLAVILGGIVLARGGVAETWAAAQAAQQVARSGAGAVPLLATLEEWAIPVCGSVVATELISRVIAARSPQVARNASFLAGGMYVLVGLVPVVVGLAATGLVTAPADAEQWLPAIAREVLPTAGYVLFAGALISAILSTVDTTLLVSAGLVSHNLVGPLLRHDSDRARLLVARGGVVAFGLVAYVLAVRAEGIFALVEQASAFGSAGALVTICFGLFTPWGGPRTAMATLVGGLVVYLGSVAAGAPYPFLASLAASLVIYVAGAFPGVRYRATA